MHVKQDACQHAHFEFAGVLAMRCARASNRWTGFPGSGRSSVVLWRYSRPQAGALRLKRALAFAACWLSLSASAPSARSTGRRSTRGSGPGSATAGSRRCSSAATASSRSPRGSRRRGARTRSCSSLCRGRRRPSGLSRSARARPASRHRSSSRGGRRPRRARGRSSARNSGRRPPSGRAHRRR